MTPFTSEFVKAQPLTQRQRLADTHLMDMTIKTPSPQKENPLISVLFSVVLPVMVLNKLSGQDAFIALVVALAFPAGYGVYSFVREGKLSFISLLGILNTLFTGGFALMKLEGIWFAVKEAAFPLLLGIFVLFSSYGSSPFLKFVLFDSGALNTSELFARVESLGVLAEFKLLVRRFTVYFSSSFFLSALLNFLLALRIFKPIPGDISESAQTEILNQQIADMTWQGYVVILLPSMVILLTTFYFFFKKLTALTGLTFEQLVNEKK